MAPDAAWKTASGAVQHAQWRTLHLRFSSKARAKARTRSLSLVPAGSKARVQPTWSHLYTFAAAERVFVLVMLPDVVLCRFTHSLSCVDKALAAGQSGCRCMWLSHERHDSKCTRDHWDCVALDIVLPLRMAYCCGVSSAAFRRRCMKPKIWNCRRSIASSVVRHGGHAAARDRMMPCATWSSFCKRRASGTRWLHRKRAFRK